MYKDKHGTVSKQHPSLIIIIVTVSTLQKKSLCEDMRRLCWMSIIVGEMVSMIGILVLTASSSVSSSASSAASSANTHLRCKYSWAKEGNYRMLHVICSMYLIWYMHLTSLNYALWHWANSKSDLQTFQQSARAATLLSASFAKCPLVSWILIAPSSL